jgi:hypothetical protein
MMGEKDKWGRMVKRGERNWARRMDGGREGGI